MTIAALKQAKNLIEHGETEEAKKLLLQYVRQDSRKEEAWLMLAGLLSSNQRIDCLEWALKTNPENANTRELLLKLDPHGGYDDPHWRKQDYVLDGIPMLDGRRNSAKDKRVFKPDITMTLRKSFGISFGFFCCFLYLRMRFHLPVPWFVYILVNIVILFIFFVFLFLCLSLHFRIITVTRKQMIIETPKYRLNRKRRIIRIEDVLVKEARETKFANKEFKIRNAEPVSIAFLSEKQMIVLSGMIMLLQKHSDM